MLFRSSISMFVMIILSIAMFVMSLVFLGNFFSATKEVQQDIDLRTKQQIDSLLDNGARVALPLYNGDIKGGQSGNFGLGILNTGGTGDFFYVDVICSKILRTDATVDCDLEPETISLRDKFTLEKNKKTSITILLRTTSQSYGKYIYNVYVCNSADEDIDACEKDDPNLYDSVQKIYLDVN